MLYQGMLLAGGQLLFNFWGGSGLFSLFFFFLVPPSFRESIGATTRSNVSLGFLDGGPRPSELLVI